MIRPCRAAVAAAALALTACGGATAVTTPAPSRSPAVPPPRACTPGDLPQAGFSADAAHSGPLSVSRYSPNGDMQAALVYFHFESGVRQVFTDLGPTPPAAAGAAGPASPHDQLVVCDAIEFQDPGGAQGFVGAFRQLRLDAGQSESSPPALADTQVAFLDHAQSFIGYPIQNAAGAEIAVARGAHFYSVSVFGPSPTLATAAAVIRAVLGEAR